MASLDPEELIDDEDNIVAASQLGMVMSALEASHDARFDCTSYDPTTVTDDGQGVVVCAQCRFVVARLPADEEVTDDE